MSLGTQPVGAATPEGDGGAPITDQQRRFFETFGFLELPGRFRDDMAAVAEAFDEVFAAQTPWEMNEALHFNERRLIVPDITSAHPVLGALVTDPRTRTIVSGLLGDGYEPGVSDGSIFSCDTSWHSDTFGAPMDEYHLKLSFYLEPLDHDSGAIRMIPGTNDWMAPFSKSLRRDLLDPAAIEERFGVQPDEIPSWTLRSTPGDVVVWNYRTIHASFNGGQRRRLLSLNFRAAG